MINKKLKLKLKLQKHIIKLLKKHFNAKIIDDSIVNYTEYQLLRNLDSKPKLLLNINYLIENCCVSKSNNNELFLLPEGVL